MTEIRLKIKCAANENHQKILKMGSGASDNPKLAKLRHLTNQIAEIICGTSPLYIHPPGEFSPIGKCAACGSRLSYEIEEVEKGRD